MKYLTVTADYTQSGLRDDFDGPVQPESLDLPAGLCSDLQVWNEQYRKIIPLSKEARNQVDVTDVVRQLDAEGLRLAARVAAALEEAKVRYYSEGQLRYIHPDSNPE